MREEAERWWKQAEHDMKTAEYNLKGEILDAAAFYCQQAVEKALKAIFIHIKKSSPGATHSLVYLANELELPVKFYRFLKELSTEFIVSRYPDVAGDVPYKTYKKEVVQDYIKEAKEVIEWLKSQTKK